MMNHDVLETQSLASTRSKLNSLCIVFIIYNFFGANLISALVSKYVPGLQGVGFWQYSILIWLYFGYLLWRYYQYYLLEMENLDKDSAPRNGRGVYQVDEFKPTYPNYFAQYISHQLVRVSKDRNGDMFISNIFPLKSFHSIKYNFGFWIHGIKEFPTYTIDSNNLKRVPYKFQLLNCFGSFSSLRLTESDYKKLLKYYQKGKLYYTITRPEYASLYLPFVLAGLFVLSSIVRSLIILL